MSHYTPQPADSSDRTLTLVQVLASVQYALNQIPRRTLRGDPNGLKDTYELAKHVDEHLYFRQENKTEEDQP